MNALEVEGLTCHVGGNAILSDVSFRVGEGQWLSVIGPNGAGKTTLLRCLMGMLDAGGAICVFGKDVRDYVRRDLAQRLSYVPQADGAYVPFRVYEFVLMGRYPYLSPFSSISGEDKAAAMAAMASTETEALAERSMHTLSGGERQRVFIAAALAQGHNVLLLDEPAAFLDYKHQISVHALLRRLCRDEGVTIVSVTHDATRATFESDCVLALKGGRSVYFGSPDALHDGVILEQVYDTPFRVMSAADGVPPHVVPVEGSE